MPKQGERIIVVGDHRGAWPVDGEPVVIRDGDRVVPATVDCLMCFEQRDDDKLTGYSWGLALRDVGLEGVPIGSVVKPERSDRPNS